MTVKLYPHQQKALEKLDNGKILWGDVGTGKTLVAMTYYIQKEAPRDVYVITTAKKRDSLDWQKDAARYGVGRDPKGTVAGVLTVDSWNSISKYIDVENAFFIFDEQRLVGSGGWVKAFIQISKRNRWILLTATPGDTWLDYIPVFIANGFYKNRTEFLREHVIYSRYTKFPKVERYVGVNKLVRLRNSLLVDMPYIRHTTRVTKKIEVDYDHELFRRVLKDRWHVYEQRPLRDVAELFLVMRKVVNSSPGRLKSLETLIANHPKIIVFYNFDYELEALRYLLTNVRMRSSICQEASTSVSDAREQSIETSFSLKQPIHMISKNMSGFGTACSIETISEAEECQNQSTGISTTTSPYIRGISSDSLLSSKLESTSSCPGILNGPTTSLKKSIKKQIQTPVNIESLQEFRMSPHSSSVLAATQPSTKDGSFKITGNTTESTIVGSGKVLATVEDGASNSGFSVAEWNGHKHEPIPTTDRWVYLVQYQAGAEGWNCTETDVMVFYSLTYSYKLWHQAHGRIDRLNTRFSTLYYYVFMSNSLIDRAIWKALSSKKSFNERQFVGKITTHFTD